MTSVSRPKGGRHFDTVGFIAPIADGEASVLRALKRIREHAREGLMTATTEEDFASFTRMYEAASALMDDICTQAMDRLQDRT